MKILMTVLAATALAAGCAAAPAASPTPSPSPSPEATATPDAPTPVAPAPTPTTEPSPELPDLIGEVPEEILLEIMQETANSTGVNLAELTLERAEAVTWSDAGLGCPEPGQVYAQMLVDGYWVVIEAGGETYDFRAAGDGTWRLCPPGMGNPPLEEQF